MAKTISYYTALFVLVFGVGFGLSYSVCSLFNVGATPVQTQSRSSKMMMRMR